MHRRRAFTLVEVLVVVAIIGVLASIAVPMFQRAQLQAKRSEVPTLLAGILDATTAWRVAHDEPLETPDDKFFPDPDPGRQARAWVTGTAFDDLGWAPDGEVRGSYAFKYADSERYEAYGLSDVDGDGDMSWWTADHDQGVRMVTGSETY